MEITGTETEKNLQKAFEINAKRSMEYNIYALIAKQFGHEDISKLLTRFADNEREHAKLWYKWLNNGKFPNLTYCIKNALTQEKDEIEGVYDAFAKKAKEEGLEHISGLFENIENIEKVHYDRLKKLVLKLEDNVEPNADGTYNWVCSVCGAAFLQKDEPDFCPLCLKEDVFFYKENINS